MAGVSGSSIAIAIVIVLISVVAYYLWTPPVGLCSGVQTRPCTPIPVCGPNYDPNRLQYPLPYQKCDPGTGQFLPCVASCATGYTWDAIAQVCVPANVQGCQKDSDCGPGRISGGCSCDVQTGLCKCKNGYKPGVTCTPALACKANGGSCSPGENCDNPTCGLGVCGPDSFSCQCPPDPNNPGLKNWVSGQDNHGNPVMCYACNTNTGAGIAYGPGNTVPGLDRRQYCAKIWVGPTGASNEDGAQLLANNCAYSHGYEGCNEFNYHQNDVYYDGTHGGVLSQLGSCVNSGSTCDNCPGSYDNARALCDVAGWFDTSVSFPQSCPPSSAPSRDPSSYMCCGYTFAGDEPSCPNTGGQ